ncbi:MAG: MBL fold metallo-hydrolase, partial [Candidatus Eisenbacteria bacterium]|nr:MBL fold metallo-hydrolase [Candidatus Eisenbacteria bacterium]
MTLRSSLGTAVVALSILTGAASAQDFSAVQIATTRVAPGIYRLAGEGGNIGLCIGPDGALLIDDQYAELSEKIQAAVKEVTDQPIRYVVNTHCHGDHTGGNEKLRKLGSLVVAQDNARRRMTESLVNEVFRVELPPPPPGNLPLLTFNDTV